MEKIKSKEKWIKIVFIIAIFIFCLICAVKQPYEIGPDERMKMDVCRYIQEHNALPNGGDEEIRNPLWGISYAFTPILSYMFSAVFMKLTAIFTSDFSALVVAARFMSVLCYTGTAIMVMKIAEKMFKGLRSIYKWAFIVLITCLPQFIFIGTYINNDSLASFSISVIIYSWIIGLESNWSKKSIIMLGIGVGVCALSYYNAYGFILTSVIIYIASYFVNKKDKKVDYKNLFIKGFIISIITLLICGWWFVRSYIIYDGDFLGLNITEEYAEKYAQEENKPSKRETPQNLNESILKMLIGRQWIETTVKSFIGLFGVMNILMSTQVYYMYSVIYFGGIIGYIIYFINNVRKKYYIQNKNKLLIEIIFSINIIIPILLSVYYSYCSDFQPQGRYIMPMLIPFMYFVTKGLETIIEKVVKSEKVKNIGFTIVIFVLYVIPIIYLIKMWK